MKGIRLGIITVLSFYGKSPGPKQNRLIPHNSPECKMATRLPHAVTCDMRTRARVNAVTVRCASSSACTAERYIRPSGLQHFILQVRINADSRLADGPCYS
jgi:hypothetical protein